MTGEEGFFSWIHLSDWHEGKPEPLMTYDRTKLLAALKQDVEQRRTLDSRLERVDAIIFSGDIAWSGQKVQFDRAASTLIQPILQILGGTPCLILAPGNHDLDREIAANTELTEDAQINWSKTLQNNSHDGYKKIGHLLTDKASSSYALSPFKKFYDFSKELGFEYDVDKTVKVVRICKGDNSHTLGIATINSALCCSRNAMASGPAEEKRHWDYGLLSITEQQIDSAISATKMDSLKILVMHHPMNWLSEAERAKIEGRIVKHFDIVVHGHEHLPKFILHAGNTGEVIVIPAGSAYDGRVAAEPSYTNAFNYGIVDISSKCGVIHHRRWDEEAAEGGAWAKDQRFWELGKSHFVIQDKERYRPANKKYIHKIDRLYRQSFTKRPFREMEINLKQFPLEIGGRQFIVCHHHQKFWIADGPEEPYTITLGTNERVLRSKSRRVRGMALYDIKLPEFFGTHTYCGGDRHIIKDIVPEGEQVIDYEFKRLELPDGVWYFAVNRFADNLSFYVEKAKGYAYETAEVGGALPLVQTARGIRAGELFRAPEGHVPHQGYMIQWYPKGASSPRAAEKHSRARNATEGGPAPEITPPVRDVGATRPR